MKGILYIITHIISAYVFSQDSTRGSLTFSGYVEVYYQYDFNRPADNTRATFIYSHNRHNEFNLNLGFLKANYSSSRARANLAIGIGTYMNANYIAESGVLKNIFEASAGIRLGKKNLWIDAGIMPSHIGFESAIGKDCWTLTRSILADNSPYFETGSKLTYTTDNSKWVFCAIALNGWQRITRLNGNSSMSWGTQIQYRPFDKLLLNYSGFAGTDKPDSTNLNRLFHNVYGIFNISDHIGITTGFDIGQEQKTPGSNDWNTWYSPVFILRYSMNDKWAMAVRGEYYNDEYGVIIATGTANGFKTKAISFNIDHSPTGKVIARVEARMLHSKDKIFMKQNALTNKDIFITTALAVSF
jgi:hypothetical protein